MPDSSKVASQILSDEYSSLKHNYSEQWYPLPLVLRKVFKTWWISPDFAFVWLQSIDFKELLVQGFPKMGLSTPGLARRGVWVMLVLVLPPASIV